MFGFWLRRFCDRNKVTMSIELVGYTRNGKLTLYRNDKSVYRFFYIGELGTRGFQAFLLKVLHELNNEER